MNEIKKHIRYHQNGQIEEEGSYYRDFELDPTPDDITNVTEVEVKVGKWTYWYENGQKKMEITYNQEGKKDGSWICWNENGIKTRDWNYFGGIEHGKSILWYDNGKKQEELEYSLGKHEGCSNRWYKNGNKQLQGSYKNDEPIGKWTWYNEDGTVSHEKNHSILSNKLSSWKRFFD